MIIFYSDLDEAMHVYEWHMHSDKTTEKKHSNMSIEEAEMIINEHNNPNT
ncbi:hypothetical protein [Photobacterium leiognathi]|nr:hypothetical protein [Photobacterium leiognathi]